MNLFSPSTVMAALVAAIHSLVAGPRAWVAGTSPAMTDESVAPP